MAALVWDEDMIPLCSHRHRAGAEQPKVGCVTRKSSAWLSWPCCPPADSRQCACKVSLLQSRTREGVLPCAEQGNTLLCTAPKQGHAEGHGPGVEISSPETTHVDVPGHINTPSMCMESAVK